MFSEADASIAAVFAADGPLAARLSGYRPRPQQVEMAQAIGRAIQSNSVLIAEAGTGTGKTFSYLVPALMLGGKVIVSTGTKTLQDQLVGRDLPAIREALSMPVSLAALKGRANYVCRYHLAQTASQGRLHSREEAAQVRVIEQFATLSGSGDKGELAQIPESAPIWAMVTSTRENCLGSECEFHKDCFVMQARKKAQAADVVVVNHHLFFADLALREEGVSELLPTANTVVFDEAHQLPEVATLFFGQTFSTRQVLDLARDSVAAGLAYARDAGSWSEEAAKLERSARDLRLACGAEQGKYPIASFSSNAEFHDALEKLFTQLQAFKAFVMPHAARHPEIESVAQRSLELLDRMTDWPKEDEAVIRWIDVFAQSVQLHRTPLSVAQLFSQQREGRPQAWILASATLTVKNDFSHFARRLGLEEAPTGRWESPFDYPSQALLYVPEGLPDPFAAGYLEALVEAAWPVAQASPGGVFFLCTTLRAMDKVADLLAARLAAAELDLPILKQGMATRTELLDRFRAHGRAFLIGSQSFWEGVDVPGAALSMVVIDKLPFAPPDDPVVAARIAALQREGGNPFMDIQLPEAAISLKQGAGRLIRSETDRGILLIGDNRLIIKPYGRKLWQSLPPFKRTRSQQEALAFWTTTPSTTDHRPDA